MRARIVALHGFLGCGADWDAVRTASRAGLDWSCPDLFAPGASDWREACRCDDKAWLAAYSFGARLALRLLAEEPHRWHGALLLSVDPGNFRTDAERDERLVADAGWADAFRTEPWDALMQRWNAQPVFGGTVPPQRREEDFDRDKLARALVEFSVAAQFTDPLRLGGALSWLAGERDGKFRALLNLMRNAGFPGVFSVVPGAGHRLLRDAPEAVASGLDSLVATR